MAHSILRVVFDTNIVVSAMLKAASAPKALLDLAFSGVLVPVVSPAILCEYEDVLYRDKFPFAAVDIEGVLASVRRVAEYRAPVELDGGMEGMPDKKDIEFYAVARASRNAGYTTYLVTGNLKHFPPEDFVVSPRAMLDILGGLP